MKRSTKAPARATARKTARKASAKTRKSSSTASKPADGSSSKRTSAKAASKPSKPSAKSASAKPAAKPAAKPTPKPAAKSAPKSAAKPGGKPRSKPPAKGAAKPKPAKGGPKSSAPPEKASKARTKSPKRGAQNPPTLELVHGQGPVRRISSRRAQTLLDLETALSERIVGKSEAIAKIARVVRVRMTQLDFRPERPNGSFLLVGPSGVGKNEFAFALAEVLFGTEDRVVSIDLGEFDDEDDLAKLGPSPVPGADGHVFEGILTSPVRKQPESILLLRGIERAHPAFQRLLAQILDSGSIEDMFGPVDFRNTIIFVTHHVSRDDAAPGAIGFARPSKTAETLRREQLELYVLPDLLESFNEVIELPPLSAGEVRQIARYKVRKVLDRMGRRKRAITVSESVYDELISDDLCRVGGAKFLNRTLEERLFNPLARYMLTHRSSRQISVGVDHGRIVIS